MTDGKQNQKIRYQICGWVLFVLCAVFFIASSLKNGDRLGLVASIIFLIACFVFIIPLVINSRKGSGDQRSK
jgi:Flp pilus assembly protein protease CpaA